MKSDFYTQFGNRLAKPERQRKGKKLNRLTEGNNSSLQEHWSNYKVKEKSNILKDGIFSSTDMSKSNSMAIEGFE